MGTDFTQGHINTCRVEIVANGQDVIVYRDFYGQHDPLQVYANHVRYIKEAVWLPNGRIRIIIYGPVRDEIRDYTGIGRYELVVPAI